MSQRLRSFLWDSVDVVHFNGLGERIAFFIGGWKMEYVYPLPTDCPPPPFSSLVLRAQQTDGNSAFGHSHSTGTWPRPESIRSDFLFFCARGRHHTYLKMAFSPFFFELTFFFESPNHINVICTGDAKVVSFDNSCR